MERLTVTGKHCDSLAFNIFLFGGIFLLCYEALFVLPSYDPGKVQYVWLHYIVAGWLAFSIYGNMYKLKTTNIVYKGRRDDGVISNKPRGWKYCRVCVMDTPPRSHHCKVCNVCILKRDHHCWFATGCIGYHNHRYYVVMVTYMVITGVYCNLFNSDFVSSVTGGFSVLNVIWFMGPHVGWVFGYLDGYEFFVYTLSSAGIIMTVLFTWLLVIQIIQIRSGQTKYERTMGIHNYNIRRQWNTEEVFGEKSFLVFLSPFLNSALPGDGIIFSSAD
ncbi:probable palmitoyltransferase ZDHHC24 [Ylistrum balloti]|uniref:probable palmitoyltransferase ZDHHC24 n=1 Tax=Ylistrum balloti TaxID=509963 RepID=UPI002905EE92|nr:probable palmitoyltransferase ZDHHC24 [Ylistrum balloti]